MSESKVPLPDHPEPWAFKWTSLELDSITRYGDARASEARRLALLEAAELAATATNDSDYLVDPDEFIADRLRALADEASRKEA